MDNVRHRNDFLLPALPSSIYKSVHIPLVQKAPTLFSVDRSIDAKNPYFSRLRKRNRGVKLKKLLSYGVNNFKIEKESSAEKAVVLQKLNTVLNLLGSLPFLRNHAKEKVQRLKEGYEELEKGSLQEITREYKLLLAEYKEAMPSHNRSTDLSRLKGSMNRSVDARLAGIELDGLRGRVAKIVGINNERGRSLKSPTCFHRHKFKTIIVKRQIVGDKSIEEPEFEGILHGKAVKGSRNRSLSKSKRGLRKYTDKSQNNKSVLLKLPGAAAEIPYTNEIKEDKVTVEKWENKRKGDIYFDDFYENFSLSKIDFFSISKPAHGTGNQH